MSKFDSLPNELIICIFEYFKAEEKFNLFFNLNQRLRKLVKQHVWFSRLQLKNDIKKLSEVCNRYKNFDYIDDGQIFYLIPFHNEHQYHHDFNSNDIQWHITRQKPILISDSRIKEIIEKYPVRLNPLFYQFGLTFSSEFQYFIREHYPLQFNHLQPIFSNRSHGNCFQFNNNITNDLCIHLEFILQTERKHLTNTILKAAYHIWKEMQQIDDLNILNIKYHL